MQPAKAIVGGIVGAGVLTVVLAMARGLGIPLNLEVMFGSLITGTTGPTTWMLGFVLLLMRGIVLGLIYAAIFEYVIHRAGWKWGVALGAAQAILAGLILGALPAIHPLIPESMPAPGMFMSHLGTAAVVTFFMINMLFGAIVGAVYDPIKVEHQRQRPSAVPAR